MKLTREETYLLERAQARGDVTSDVRDHDDAVTEAYRDWCRDERWPFLHIAFGDATARVIYSMIEADTLFTAETEARLRRHLPTWCLLHGELEMEDDYLIAGRVLNDLLPALQECLCEVSNEIIERIHTMR